MLVSADWKFNILWATYNKPTMKIPDSAIFFLVFICRPMTTGIGMANMNMSPIQDKTPLVSPMVINGFAIQCPPLMVLFQKY